MQHDGQVLLGRISVLAETLHDPQARCSAFLDVALAQKRLNRESEMSLSEAVECVGKETATDAKVRLLCDIALAQPSLQKSAVPFMRQAKTLTVSGTRTGRFRITFTEALLASPAHNMFEQALGEAHKLHTVGLRTRAFADVAFSQIKMSAFDAARDTIDAIEDPYEATHMLAELALAEHRAGRDGALALAAARRMAESLQAPDRKLEAQCFIAVALASTDLHAALQILLTIQDEAENLSNPVLAAHVNCQIASAKAQMGLLEEAKLRADRIPESSYRDSAWRSIASEEAKRGCFEDAIETVQRMRASHLRERAMSRVIGWMARVSADTIEKIGDCDMSQSPV